MDALFAIATLGLFLFGGFATYTIGEQRHRYRWQREVEAGQAQAPRRAPKPIRTTALWSIYMGQMTVPGGLLGLFGLFAGGIGLVGIPGMILGVRIWRLGFALLRRDPGAAVEARKLARFAYWLNFIAVVVGLAVALVGGLDLLFLPVILAVYGAVSIAHANAMIRCADRLDAVRQHGVEVGFQVPAA